MLIPRHLGLKNPVRHVTPFLFSQRAEIERLLLPSQLKEKVRPSVLATGTIANGRCSSVLFVTLTLKWLLL